MTSITIPTPTVSALPPFNISVVRLVMHGSVTSCLVSSLGPMTEVSCPVALAEMVMIALRKSPAEVCVAGECIGVIYDKSIGIRS